MGARGVVTEKKSERLGDVLEAIIRGVKRTRAVRTAAVVRSCNVRQYGLVGRYEPGEGLLDQGFTTQGRYATRLAQIAGPSQSPEVPVNGHQDSRDCDSEKNDR
jgi:hypothetical protein